MKMLIERAQGGEQASYRSRRARDAEAGSEEQRRVCKTLMCGDADTARRRSYTMWQQGARDGAGPFAVSARHNGQGCPCWPVHLRSKRRKRIPPETRHTEPSLCMHEHWALVPQSGRMTDSAWVPSCRQERIVRGHSRETSSPRKSLPWPANRSQISCTNISLSSQQNPCATQSGKRLGLSVLLGSPCQAARPAPHRHMKLLI